MSDLRLRRELALISASDGVDETSVRSWCALTSRELNIAFSIAAGVPVRVAEVRVRAEEPVRLHYWREAQVGVVAPSVFVDRSDFPKDIGHINFSPEGEPAHLCLADTGLQALYDRGGIFGVVQRLRQWLRDARAGALMAGGWEPVPVTAEREAMVMFDAAAFQEHTAITPQGSPTFGVTRMLGTPDQPVCFALEAPSNQSNIGAVTEAAKKQRGDKRLNGDAAWALASIFVWQDVAEATALPVFSSWSTLGSMKAALARTGLLKPLLDGLATAVANSGAVRHEDKYGVVLILGIRRPVPLQSSIFGLSTHAQHRAMELRAFFVTAWTAAELLHDSAPIHALTAYPVIAPELLSWTSRGPDAPKIKTVGLIGAGALGSALADHLLRAGADELVVVDRDALAPHNLARHIGRLKDIGHPKSEVIAGLADELAFRGLSARVDSVSRNVATMPPEDEERLRKVGVLVDATADERVRSWVSRFAETHGLQVVRVEMRRRGRLGIACVSGPGGNPSQTDLYAELCYAALHDDEVAAWLDEDAREGSGEESIRLAAGCASATIRMTSSVVAAHAAAFMPSVFQGAVGRHQPGVGINVLDRDFRPRGWRWIDVPPYSVQDVSGWRVRLARRVEDLIDAEAAKAGRVETGGYLYGRIDYATQEVTVVCATGQPPGTDASAVSLRLTPAGRTRLERHLCTRPKGKLHVVGTWHTHPGGAATPSATDLRTFDEAFAIDQSRGLPSLFLIRGAAGSAVYLRV